MKHEKKWPRWQVLVALLTSLSPWESNEKKFLLKRVTVIARLYKLLYVQICSLGVKVFIHDLLFEGKGWTSANVYYIWKGCNQILSSWQTILSQ